MSEQPLTVVIDGANTQWNLDVSLSDCPPPPGTLTAEKTHCNGGTYVAAIHVQPKLTFTRVDDPSQVWVLDTGCTSPPMPYQVLQSPSPVHWVHDPDPRQTPEVDYSSQFHPALKAVTYTCGDFEPDGDADAHDLAALLASALGDPGSANYVAAADFDADGLVSAADYAAWTCCLRCFIADPAAEPPLGSTGDFDVDGDLDLRDAARIQQCFSSGNGFPCSIKFDYDHDSDIDLADVAEFLNALSGPIATAE